MRAPVSLSRGTTDSSPSATAQSSCHTPGPPRFACLWPALAHMVQEWLPRGAAAPTSSRLHPLQQPKFGELHLSAAGWTVHVFEVLRLVRGTSHIVDVLDVLHRDRLALCIHDGAFSAMDLSARHPRTGELLSTVTFNGPDPRRRRRTPVGADVRLTRRASRARPGHDRTARPGLRPAHERRARDPPPTLWPLPDARRRRGGPGPAHGPPPVREPSTRSPDRTMITGLALTAVASPEAFHKPRSRGQRHVRSFAVPATPRSSRWTSGLARTDLGADSAAFGRSP